MQCLSIKYILYYHNRELLEFWKGQIDQAKRFQTWLQKLIDLRYNLQNGGWSQEDLQHVENIINLVIGIQLPEVDLDYYYSSYGMTI